MDSNEDNIAYCCRYKEGDLSRLHCCDHEEYCYDNTYDYNECLRHGQERNFDNLKKIIIRKVY